MQAAPEIEAGKLKIYFEKPDSILINSIHPFCFICGEAITTADNVVIVIKTISTLRITPECFQVFLKGLALTVAADEYMHIYKSNLQ